MQAAATEVCVFFASTAGTVAVSGTGIAAAGTVAIASASAAAAVIAGGVAMSDANAGFEKNAASADDGGKGK